MKPQEFAAWTLAACLASGFAAAETKPPRSPADSSGLTHESLLAHVLKVLEQKPECVVKTTSNPDLRIARIPEVLWHGKIEPLQVHLTEMIRVGSGDDSVKTEPIELTRTLDMYSAAVSAVSLSPRVVLHIGKHAPDESFREVLAAIRKTSVRLIHMTNDPYESFLGCSASARPALQQIEALSVPATDLPKQSLTAAIAMTISIS